MVLFQVEKYSILHHLQTFTVARPLTPYTNSNIVISEIHRSNIELTCVLLKLLISSFVSYVAYMFLFILLCGDIHPNPGPISRQKLESASTSFTSSSQSVDISNHLSFMHYNVQSIIKKLDILYTEFKDFDILSFSETWLTETSLTQDLYFPDFNPPERKDRPGDSHGGVLVYT
ncbi:hypothetical protein DPMN_187335 [Dreissena polymorpha]|uniref:Uncharacterized protein n=1 Tax=Dreissena polymorpha TaxID=45954 RepID=A0A9D4I8Z1_DREPO|nr:hypothetical protein DPMN_187335 [Dreissena polymorpha]